MARLKEITITTGFKYSIPGAFTSVEAIASETHTLEAGDDVEELKKETRRRLRQEVFDEVARGVRKYEGGQGEQSTAVASRRGRS